MNPPARHVLLVIFFLLMAHGPAFAQSSGPAGDTTATNAPSTPSTAPPLTVGFRSTDFFDGGADAVTPYNLSATADERTAVLEWQTATETGNDGFRIERRTGETEEWARVAFVESKAQGGTSQEPLSYQYRATGLDYGAHTFRLVQRDLGGSRTPVGSEQIIEIGLSRAYDLSNAYPNPFRERVTFELAVRERQEVSVSVYDALGRRVRMLHEGSMPAQETRRAVLVR